MESVAEVEVRVIRAEESDFVFSLAVETVFVLASPPEAIFTSLPEQQNGGDDEDACATSEVERVTGDVVGRVLGQVAPGSNEASNITEQDDNTDGTSLLRVVVGVDRSVSREERTLCERTDTCNKSGCVPSVEVLGTQEHGVAGKHEHGANHDERRADLEFGRGKRERQDADRADKVGRNSEQLLLDDCLAWEETADDGGEEEGNALHCTRDNRVCQMVHRWVGRSK